MKHTALVVGAGIAGLSAAISLTRAGWQVTVLERSAQLGELGAGFAMSRNAVAAFRGLGFTEDDLAALGTPIGVAGNCDLHGRPLMRVPDDPATQASLTLIGVHRRRLHETLQRGAIAAGAEIVTDRPVHDVTAGTPGGELAQVGDREAELVVAADGMFSAVRTQLVPQYPAIYSGYSSWRAIARRRPGEDGFRQYWGPRAEFGILPVSTTETYWYGYVAMPQRYRVPDELATAHRRFTAWAPEVRERIEHTPPDALLRHDVYHLPRGIPRYDQGRVVLIGDAAHGFLPTMGQGAATALEDGLCVGLLIGVPVSGGEPLDTALRSFDRRRRPRCRALGRASISTARFGAHLGPGRLQTLRNALLRRLPAGLITRGADAAMGWTPPAPISSSRGRAISVTGDRDSTT